MALQPGDRFGRYELVSWLGRGGMAETWRARWMGDAGVTKSVLIKKVLPEFVADDAFVSMFVNEARISATLSHGNIAQVFDFGRVDGQYYLAMELVDGPPLHRIMKRAVKTGLPRLPIPIATYITLEICRGLHYAHTRTDDKGVPLGIVHRDISPDNVLVSYEGQVKIVDFGIAKARMARNFQTEPGVVKGKYLFFSPEQARGREVDARTDVWATGLVLYEMLCGQPPVSGSQAAVMMKMANGEFPSPREVYAGIPEELDDIVMKALSVDLSARYESANAFADALAGFLYSYSPRFSAMNLAYLARVLFRGDMAQEGRELSVPPSFIDELTLWRQQAETPAEEPPQPARGSKPVVSQVLSKVETDLKPRPQRATRKLLPAVSEAPPPVVDDAPEVPTHATGSLARGTKWGMLMVAAAVVGALWGGVYWLFGRSRELPLPQSSRPQVNPAYPIPGRLDEEQGARRMSAAELAEEARKKAQRARDDGAYRSAADFADQCLKNVPDHPQCLLIAGASHARDGRFEEAAARYQRFVERHPEHDFAKTARTLVEEYSRKSAEAKVAQPKEAPPGYKVIYDKDAPANPPAGAGSATSSNPSTPESVARDLVQKTRELLKRQKYPAALDIAQECHAMFPEDPDCHLVLGITYARLNKIDEGAKSYRRFLELAPKNHPSRSGVTSLLKAYDSSRY
ncbi:protein kinase domain-containing protein [Myxococcus faecalis]|uniref:protein kinase domain-containing protein n=1 Tax=Myxococcus faecalis TaxID=3115646 RepID=UPI0038D14D73